MKIDRWLFDSPCHNQIVGENKRKAFRRMPMSLRQSTFNETLFNYTARGATILMRDDNLCKAVVAEYFRYRKTNHFSHLLMSLVTGGIWFVVWALLIIVRWNKPNILEQRYVVAVDEESRVKLEKVG